MSRLRGLSLICHGHPSPKKEKGDRGRLKVMLYRLVLLGHECLDAGRFWVIPARSPTRAESSAPARVIRAVTIAPRADRLWWKNKLLGKVPAFEAVHIDGHEVVRRLADRAFFNAGDRPDHGHQFAAQIDGIDKTVHIGVNTSQGRRAKNRPCAFIKGNGRDFKLRFVLLISHANDFAAKTRFLPNVQLWRALHRLQIHLRRVGSSTDIRRHGDTTRQQYRAKTYNADRETFRVKNRTLNNRKRVNH